jgi:hypothetical protein
MLTAQNKLSKYSIILTGFISLLMIYFFIWRTNAIGYHTVIDGDAKDYYAYLKAIFIDKNLGNQDTTPWYVIQTPTGTINVHTAGVSLLLLPFFLIGYVWASWFGYPLTGLSAPFEKMISIGALFYALMGLYFIRKLLIKLNIKDPIIAFVIPLIFFGTHLLNYSLNEPAMSHVYSFAMISAFFYLSFQIFNSGERKYFLLAAFVLGLIVLVRPINGIVIGIIPFWSDSLKQFMEKTKSIFIKNFKTIIFSTLTFILTIFIQAFVWLAQNGKIMQWSYKDNGLYFFSPNTFKMLFGFNAGFFIYTPLCLLMMLGFIPLFKENSYKFFALFLFLMFVFYLFSCHWAYTYFDGLSIRPMVDIMPVFAILGAKLISSVEGKLKTITVPALGLLLALNLITCYQYKAGILPPASMNYEKYKYIFLKTDTKYAGVLGGCNDLLPYSKHHPEKSFSYESPMGEKDVFDYNNKEYGLGYQIPALGFNSSKIYVKASLQRRESIINASEKALIVFSIESTTDNKKNTAYIKLNDTPSGTCGEWKKWNYNLTMDGGIKATDKFIVYVWNTEKKNFLVKDLKVEVYNYNYEE